MHLELLSPPALIGIATDDGAVRPALLLAARGERRYVQVSHGPGANCLRWVDAAQVRPAVPSAWRDEQALRADAERPRQVVQHGGRQPRAAR